MPPVTNSDNKLVGQYIGGVRIDRLLAKGLLSDVYLGFHPNLNIHVAVKILSPKVMAQGMSTERFIREGRALAQLAHPNIIKIHNVGVEQNKYFIVMDFVHDAVNLRTLAKKQFLKPYQSLIVTRRMAEALDYIHSKGFIHRDIKPANICLRQNGQPILMDFSLIKDESSDIQLTAPGTIMGTVNFMPPEQAQPGGPFGRVAPASDVYSLGATFYWLLTGQAPFKGRTPMETIIKLIRDPIIKASDVNESVPAEIDDLCLRCLQKNPLDRFQTARELINAIDGAVQRKRAEIQAMRAPEASGESGSGRAPASTGRLNPAPTPQNPAPRPTANWGSPQTGSLPRGPLTNPAENPGHRMAPPPQRMAAPPPQRMAPPPQPMSAPPPTRTFAPPPSTAPLPPQPQNAFPPPTPPRSTGNWSAGSPSASSSNQFPATSPNMGVDPAGHPLNPPGPSAPPINAPTPAPQTKAWSQPEAPAQSPQAPERTETPTKARNPLLKPRSAPPPKKSKLPLILTIIILLLMLAGGGLGGYYYYYDALPF